MAKKALAAAQTPGAAKPLAVKSAVPSPLAVRVSRPRSIALEDFWLGLLLLGVTLAVYGPALHGGLIWDDDGHVTKPELQSLHGLARIWLELGATQQYYPLLHSAFWLEHYLWGDATLGYHLINVLLHVTSACLLVAVMRRLALPGAWCAAFLFALHPVCVEAVAWISEQKSTLSTVFYLSSALVYLNYDRTRRWPRYFLALGLFLLALLSKSVTATLPAALLVVFWWKRGRLEWNRDVRPLLPWLVLGAMIGLFTAWVERTYIGAHGAAFTLTPVERLLLAGRVIWFYLGKFLWPANLIFTYPRWKVDSAVGWQYLYPLGVVALTGGLLLAARWRRGPLAAFLYFAGTLFPVMGFFNVYPFKYSYVADHFQYLACLGLIGLLAAGVTQAAGTLNTLGRRLVYGLIGALLLAAAGLTYRQTGIYRDGLTLYRATLARNPDDWMAHNNLAVILVKMPGHAAEAAAEYKAALALKSDEASMHSNLGEALSKIPGQLPDAIAEYQAGLRLDPDAADIHNNLGVALMKIPSRAEEAIAEFKASLRINPDNAQVHYNFGTLLMKNPARLPEAVAEYQAALRLDPNFAEAHCDLGNVLAKMPDRSAEAMAEYQAALRINPDMAEAHDGLGNALSRIGGRWPEAIEEYEAAVRINPNFSQAHYSLGSALTKVPGHRPEAIGEYEAALRINPDFPEAHNNLGCALAGMPGRLSDAIAHFQAALRIKPDYAEAHKNLGLALLNVPGRQPEAIKHFQAAVQIGPNSAEAHHDLGDALMGAPGKLPEAIEQYETALRIDPELAVVQNNLGCALASAPGRMSDAIAHFQAALRINPDYAEAHKNLGLALLTIPGRQIDAKTEFATALRIDPALEAARQQLEQLSRSPSGSAH